VSTRQAPERGAQAPPAGLGPFRVVLEAEQGQVVAQAALDVLGDQLDETIEDDLEPLLGERRLQRGLVDELPVGVAGLDQPVGEADQPVARHQPPAALGRAVAEAERRPHPGQCGRRAERDRVPGRGQGEPAVGVDPADQGGHEVLVLAFAAHQPVQPGEDAARPGALPGQAPERALQHGGQRAGLQALAAGVGDDEREAVLTDLDHVVEVAADLGELAGRLVADPDRVPARPRGWHRQQQGQHVLEHLGLAARPLGPDDGAGAQLGEAGRRLQVGAGQPWIAPPGQREGAHRAALVGQRQPQHHRQVAGG
jgi:hypothetical protein